MNTEIHLLEMDYYIAKITHLPDEASTNDLRYFFANCNVARVLIAWGPQRTAFAAFFSLEDLERAMLKHRLPLKGKYLSVSPCSAAEMHRIVNEIHPGYYPEPKLEMAPSNESEYLHVVRLRTIFENSSP